MFLLLTWVLAGYIAFILDENAQAIVSRRDEQFRKSVIYVLCGYFGLGYATGKFYR